MKKTIISHFYNEEYLLPWWLNHHKRFFDHGILIDYHSTDKSCDIIKEICPNWSIVKTNNKYFDSKTIDIEVTNIEKRIDGWRMCLNTTEFLVGDYSILDNLIDNRYRLMIGNYIFVDNINTYFSYDKPLYDQIKYGYHQNPMIGCNNLHRGDRSLRSIHNYKIRYPNRGGRHFSGRESTQNLIIFYYGYLLNIDQMIKRKLQIQNKMSPKEITTLKSNGDHPNIVTENSFKSRILQHQLPKCIDMTSHIDRLIQLQEKYIEQKNNYNSSI